MKADDDEDGVKDQDGEDDDPGRRLRQEGCQRLEETVDKKGEGKKMANELQAHRRRHGKSGEQRHQISRQKFFQKNMIDYPLETLLDDDDGVND